MPALCRTGLRDRYQGPAVTGLRLTPRHPSSRSESGEPSRRVRRKSSRRHGESGELTLVVSQSARRLPPPSPACHAPDDGPGRMAAMPSIVGVPGRKLTQVGAGHVAGGTCSATASGSREVRACETQRGTPPRSTRGRPPPPACATPRHVRGSRSGVPESAEWFSGTATTTTLASSPFRITGRAKAATPPSWAKRAVP